MQLKLESMYTHDQKYVDTCAHVCFSWAWYEPFDSNQAEILKTAVKRSAPSAALFKELNLSSLLSTNTYQSCIFMYKCTYLIYWLPTVFCYYLVLNSDVHSYSTTSRDIHFPFYHTNPGQYIIKYSGPLFWNSTSSAIKFFTFHCYYTSIKWKKYLSQR